MSWIYFQCPSCGWVETHSADSVDGAAYLECSRGHLWKLMVEVVVSPAIRRG